MCVCMCVCPSLTEEEEEDAERDDLKGADAAVEAARPHRETFKTLCIKIYYQVFL